MSRLIEKQAVVADEQIIEMYWQRNELAIQETDKKYGQFLFRIAYNISTRSVGLRRMPK